MASCQPQLQVSTMDSPWIIYRALVGIGTLCSLLIACVYLFTQPIIAKNRQMAVEQAIYSVLPGAITYREWRYHAIPSATFQPAGSAKQKSGVVSDSKRFYAGYDSRQKLVGIALLAQGRGYQDRILIMYGYSPTQQEIVGMRVLESRETPGLGDKIETDASFRENFVSLDVSLSQDLKELKNHIQVTKSGDKTERWQIDGITGATISSEAIGHMLQKSTEQWLPLLYQYAQSFEEGGPDE